MEMFTMRKYPGIEKLPDGRKRIRVRGVDPKTGRMKEVDRRVKVSMSEAVKLREELRDRLRGGADYRQVAVPRLAEFAESWMKSRALALKASTGRTYADLLDHHVVPSLGDFFVDKVTDADVRGWREAIVKTRSAATANNALRVLKMVYRDAVEEYDLDRNPTARVRVLPVQGYTEADPNVLAPAQLAALLTAYKEIAARQYPLALTLALTGLRYGEATALKWTDVDEEAACIRSGALSGTARSQRPRQA